MMHPNQTLRSSTAIIDDFMTCILFKHLPNNSSSDNANISTVVIVCTFGRRTLLNDILGFTQHKPIKPIFISIFVYDIRRSIVLLLLLHWLLLLLLRVWFRILVLACILPKQYTVPWSKSIIMYTLMIIILIPFTPLFARFLTWCCMLY